MGSDCTPDELIRGAELAVDELGCEIVLIGNENMFNKNVLSNKLLSFVPASEVIAMDERPTDAVLKKKNSSIVVGMRLLAEKKIDALVSAGNSGALLVAATLFLGNLEKIIRPAILANIPTRNSICALIDAGANTICKPQHLYQFGIMGSIYIHHMFKIDTPRIGIISNGKEEIKGNNLVKEAASLFYENKSLNFIGNIEGRDVMNGDVDVAVCDGFVGNVILKFYESFTELLFSLMETEFQNLKNEAKFINLKHKFNYEEYGGALLLGVNGICVKCHGRSSKEAIKNAIKLSSSLASIDINKKISEGIAKNVL